MRVSAVAPLALVVLLAGCGGGGGGGTGTTPPATGTPDESTPTATATPSSTTTGTPATDPRPDWVEETGHVDGTALVERHDAALPPTYRLSVGRSGGENLTLYGGPEAARLDVGDARRASSLRRATPSASAGS